MAGNATIWTSEDLQKLLEVTIEKTIDRKLSQLNNDAKESLLTIDETAKFFKISKMTLCTWRKKGLVKGIRKGGRIYFKRSDLF